MVQWLRLCYPNVEGTDSVSGWGIKIPHAPCCSQGKKKGGKWTHKGKSAEKTIAGIFSLTWFTKFPWPEKQFPHVELRWKEKVKWSEVAQSCPTLCDPMDCSLPGSSVHGIFQARVLEWIAISFSSGSSRPRDGTQVSRIVDSRFTVWATREVQENLDLKREAEHYYTLQAK